MDELERAIPGFSKNLSTASGNINELLSGLPSPALARNAAAYYGVQSGMPGSDYVRNKGFDLYNTQANAMRQQGQDDLLKLLSTVSGTAVATPGQTIQESQFGRNLGQQESQFGRSLAEQVAGREQQGNQFGATLGFEQQQWQKQLELLDKYLGGAYGGGGGGTGGGPLDPNRFTYANMNPYTSTDWLSTSWLPGQGGYTGGQPNGRGVTYGNPVGDWNPNGRNTTRMG